MMQTLLLISSLAALASVLAGNTVQAQTSEHRHAASAGQDENIELLSGAGMGQSRVADDHGYPGPRHTLDLASDLLLTPQQRSSIEAIHVGMKRDAVQLGQAIVAAELRLTALFAENRATEAAVQAQVEAIVALRADLRVIHLHAHLRTSAQLTAAQRARYAQLRHPAVAAAGGMS